MSGDVTAEVPPLHTLPVLGAAARECQACPLWQRATQTVFGDGAAHAPLFLIGEQPGDREDKDGHPFVGPAGRLLSEASTRTSRNPRATARSARYATIAR